MTDRTWTIVAEPDLCEGHALCIDEAPDHLTMNGDLVAITDGDVDDENLPSVRAAARVCPVAALRLERAQ